MSTTVTVLNLLLIARKIDLTVGKSVAKLEEIDLSHYGTRLFGDPSKDVGKEVENWKNNPNGGNPEEMGSYLEGDMLFPRGKSRNGLIAETYRWPDGQIPFEIVGDYGMPAKGSILHIHQQCRVSFAFRRSSDGFIRTCNQCLP